MELLGVEFYNYPDIGKELNMCLFSNAQYLPNSAWRSLLTVALRPLFLDCPKTHYEPVLDNIACPLLSFLTEKLDHEWSSVVCPIEYLVFF